MKCSLYLLLLFAASCTTHAQQTYDEQIASYRQQYKEAFITDKDSPLTAADTSFLRFYAPDTAYRVMAIFNATPHSKTFEMDTHSGEKKEYREYGTLTFKIHDTTQILHVYQSLALLREGGKYKDYLFIPFTDATTYTETFGGGRYIDLSKKDIKDNKLELDFNKCYNPYCAFAGGYSCPIPPKENELQVAIRAGEELFGKPPKDE